jgi:hypothetical protein
MGSSGSFVFRTNLSSGGLRDGDRAGRERKLVNVDQWRVSLTEPQIQPSRLGFLNDDEGVPRWLELELEQEQEQEQEQSWHNLAEWARLSRSRVVSLGTAIGHPDPHPHPCMSLHGPWLVSAWSPGSVPSCHRGLFLGGSANGPRRSMGWVGPPAV